MRLVFKKAFWVVLFVLVSCKSIAQNFTTHAVKKGETLESIAEHYKVSTQSILSYNKEISAKTVLRPRTILVVPMVTQNVPTNTEVNPDVKEEQEEPIGFTSYKVRKKETLYGIARRFHITEELIKKYNPSLYASSLKKKMILRIPKYKRVRSEDVVEVDVEFVEYVVLAKETRWSIAHNNGITVADLLRLNPDLSKESNHLAEGTRLRLPKSGGSAIAEQEIQLYASYTVPQGQTFYSLEKKFGYSENQITVLNPEIKERGGLKEGMVLRIPEKKSELGTVNTENYIFYEVKPKQTEFSLTRKFGITYKELLVLNPELIHGLKAGMVLKLPKNQEGNFRVKNALVLDNINLLDSINVTSKSKILILLPFRLHNLNLANKKEVAKSIASRRVLKYSLGMYSGALVALDSIQSLGISVDVKTLDNEWDVAKTQEIIGDEDLSQYDAIIGPSDIASLKEVALVGSASNTPVIAPVAVKESLGFENVFYSYPEVKVLRRRMIDYVKEAFTDQNIIVISDSKNRETQLLIKEEFPSAKILKVTEEKKNIGVNLNRLKALFSDKVENWVFLETDNFKVISSVSSILNSSNNKERTVRMFTTNKNSAFDKDVISNTHLSNLNFTYPSAFREVPTNSFVKRYKKKFKDTPDRYAVRGFDILYDLLLKLAYDKNLGKVNDIIGATEYNGSTFDYEKKAADGYFNKAGYIMTLQDMRIKQAK